MTSGIYTLKFKNGSFYIGKSSDIDKRWKQHRDNFTKGTHTRRMQEAYSLHGMPSFNVLLEAHPDHIDILETYYINKYWNHPSGLLNGTCPTDLSPEDVKLIEQLEGNMWELGTLDHLRYVHQLHNKLEALELEFRGTLEGTNEERMYNEIALLQREKQMFVDKTIKLQTELDAQKSRGFWSWLFGG